ncbi:Glyoxylate reductase/hydroxypyruvate reductase [Choanephora cucurbitarum]|uniref:Glyoxylate reductase/hydroxypyruvate reductase n=1 Tax=Choanephora cucurbitarum TaxID=101091 RepID=A0A1C7NQN9_9FUNG|nr:Glyoxylate reductase/hydroxypyruvate reductase [Choanephora cucurbitarum]
MRSFGLTQSSIRSSPFHTSSVANTARKVVVTRRLLQNSQKRLENQGFELIQWPEDSAMPRQKLLNDIQGAEGLICMLSDKIDKEIFDAAGSQLKVVSTMSVGYDHIDLQAAKSSQVKIGYTPDVLTDATADLTVLLTLAAARHLKSGFSAAASGEWREWRPDWLCGYQFKGRTLGVVGMGRIGQAVAYRLKAFGIDRVIYWGRQEKPDLKKTMHAEFASFDQLLKESDFVVACCALTPETAQLFNYEAFQKMKKHAIFVNTARGGVVDQEGLVRALEEGLIAGAGLDVTTPEPLPTDHPLFQLNNCIVLPHIGSATIEARETMGDMCIYNTIAGLEGEELPFGLKL